MIQREIQSVIEQKLFRGKAIILTGPRQVGKTTLSKSIAERLKANHYRRHFAKSFFWRTFQQQEIDLVEDADDFLTAFEIKWNKKATIPITNDMIFNGMSLFIALATVGFQAVKAAMEKPAEIIINE